MGKKFVGRDGLKRFWTKAKTWITGQITAEVTAKIAEFVANAPEDLDTLKEISDWITEHANSAAEMNTQIIKNQDDIKLLQNKTVESCPVDVVEKGNMHAVTSNAVADAISYSTNEVKTGGTWIDGKPIYRKTLVYEGATTANESINLGSISNFGDVKTINGSLKFDRGNVIHLGYMNNDNNKVFESTIDAGGNITTISPYNNSNSKIVITVEYTKTTD